MRLNRVGVILRFLHQLHNSVRVRFSGSRVIFLYFPSLFALSKESVGGYLRTEHLIFDR